VTATLREDFELIAAEQGLWLRNPVKPRAADLTLLLVPLSEPYPWAAAVLVDEFHAGGFQCMLNHLKCCSAGIVTSSFELPDCHYSDARLFS
jgi:hypothetical protein